MVLILLTLLLVIGVLLYRHLTKHNNYWKDRNVPGPKPSFFFGNIKDQFLRKTAAGEIFSEICSRYPEEKVIGIFRMRTPELLVMDLDIIKQIMIKDFDMFMERGVAFSEKKLGANLLHATADTWKVLRSRFSPLFSSGKLKNMTYLMTELGDKLVDYVETITRVQTEQQVYEVAKKFTQSAIAACAFGIDIESLNDELSKALHRVNQKIIANSYRYEFEMMYPGVLMRMGISLFPDEVKTFFFGLTKVIIDQRNGNPTNRNDFMDLILALRKAKKIPGLKRGSRDEKEVTIEITDELIAAQAFIFFIAGNETTACAIGYVLYLLARHPDIQNKVVEELTTVLQRHEGKLTYEAISDLNYLAKVVNESLRMHMVAETIRRCAQTDIKLPGTDIVVKKGQILLIPLNVIHRDPKYYPNPDVFDPERFSPENVAARHSCAYLPFGIGPRHCIGSYL